MSIARGDPSSFSLTKNSRHRNPRFRRRQIGAGPAGATSQGRSDSPKNARSRSRSAHNASSRRRLTRRAARTPRRRGPRARRSSRPTRVRTTDCQRSPFAQNARSSFCASAISRSSSSRWRSTASCPRTMVPATERTHFERRKRMGNLQAPIPSSFSERSEASRAGDSKSSSVPVTSRTRCRRSDSDRLGEPSRASSFSRRDRSPLSTPPDRSSRESAPGGCGLENFS